ncbi:MAG: LLM class flavin-dependent oxidoreductase, partial [Gemmatimonadota bacterium]|nr:LLM class flavin-dependent oxidoreductase [Gemmatimonadota bacterium]
LKGDGISVRDEMELARAAEAAGFGTIWHAEAYREAMVPLAAIATVTDRVGLGTSVLQWTRSLPNMELAAANLHELSGGRFILGLGSMPREWNEQWHGIAYERPLQRMREYVEALRVLWTASIEEPVDYAGEVFQIQHYFRFNGPLEGTIPIYLGVTRARMAQLAGEIAEGAIFNSQLSPVYIREVMLDEVDRGRRRAGRADKVVTATSVPTGVSADRKQAYRWVKQDIAMHVGVTSYLGTVMAFHGFEPLHDEIQAEWRAGNRTVAVDLVTDDMVDAFGLAGTPGEVMSKISDYEGAVDRVVLAPPGYTEQGDEVLANYQAIIEMVAG